MRKNNIILVSFIFIFLIIHGYFAYGTTYVKKHSVNEEVVFELLFTRTSIMNRALYSDEDIDVILMDLEQIERGKLLEEDIDCLVDSRANPTDYSFISDVKVLNVNLLDVRDDIYYFKVLVQWEVLDIKESKEKVNYYMQIQQQEGKIFLTNLKPVE